jgi:hypothetical protein
MLVADRCSGARDQFTVNCTGFTSLPETKSPSAMEGYFALFPDSEFLDQLAVTCQVMLLHVIQEALTLTYQLHEAAVSGEIFFVLLKVAADLADPFGQQCDLAFNGAGVRFFSGISGKYRGFLFFC